MHFENTFIDEASLPQSYLVKANWLSSDASITCPDGFTVSQTYDGSYMQSLNLTPANGAIWDTVYVRFEPTAELAYHDSIMHVSQDADTVYLTVSGTGLLIRFNMELTALLEGSFNGNTMDTTLNSLGLLPLAQPFNTAPWNYTGSESISAIPSTDIADWVLVELRDTTTVDLATEASRLARKAAFLTKTGEVVDTAGNSLEFTQLIVENNLFVILWHRNHLGIMSAVSLSESNDIYTYDFTTTITQAYLSGEKLLNGKAVMIGGDINADGSINDTDATLWKTEAGTSGYKATDTQMDGEVDNKDKNDIWLLNENENSQVPE